MLNSNTNSDREDELRLIFDCVDAIRDIDRDVSLFEEHINGDDESLKSTAITFTKEFLQCKEELENQLNKLL